MKGQVHHKSMGGNEGVKDSGESVPGLVTLGTTLDSLEREGLDVVKLLKDQNFRTRFKALMFGALLLGQAVPDAKAGEASSSYDRLMADSEVSTPTWQKPPRLQQLDVFLEKWVSIASAGIKREVTPTNVAGTIASLAGGPVGLVASEVVSEAMGILKEKENAERDKEFMKDLQVALSQGGGEVVHRNLDMGAVYQLRIATEEEVKQSRLLEEENEAGEATTAGDSDTVLYEVDLVDSGDATNKELIEKLRTKERIDSVTNVVTNVAVGIGVPTVLSAISSLGTGNIVETAREEVVDMVAKRVVGTVGEKVNKPWQMDAESVVKMLNWTSGIPQKYENTYYVLEHIGHPPTEDHYGRLTGGM